MGTCDTKTFDNDDAMDWAAERARRELGNGELSVIIHHLHQGPARELWVRYNTSQLEMPVAFAITTGVLARETIPAELLEHLAGALRFYEEVQADASGGRGQEL